MSKLGLVLVGLLVGWNLFVFLSYGWDKYCAIKQRWRIPERVLIIEAIVLGGVGACSAAYLFHHKTQKVYFHLAWWLGILLTGLGLYWLWPYLF